MINEVTINGIKYIAVNKKLNGNLDYSCIDCDIYKAQIPQNLSQLPLCYYGANSKVHASCYKQALKEIKRTWKKKD